MLSGIQSLRGVAALLVVFFHFGVLTAKPQYFSQNFLSNIFETGFRGVDLFFVISGFIMAHTMVERHQTVKRFAINRVLRIYTPYLPVFFALTLVYLMAPSVAQQGIVINVRYFVENILLLPRTDLATYVPVVAWTLTHEILFYMIFALFVVPRKLIGYVVFGIWMLLCLGAFFFPSYVNGYLVIILSPINLAFGFGILSRVVYGKLNARTARILLVGGLFVFSISLVLSTTDDVNTFWDFLFFSSAAAICAGGANVRIPFLQNIGNFSYSLYLIHYPALAALFIFAFKIIIPMNINMYVFSVVAILITLIISFFYYKIIEQALFVWIKSNKGFT